MSPSLKVSSFPSGLDYGIYYFTVLSTIYLSTLSVIVCQHSFPYLSYRDCIVNSVVTNVNLPNNFLFESKRNHWDSCPVYGAICSHHTILHTRCGPGGFSPCAWSPEIGEFTTADHANTSNLGFVYIFG